VRTTEVRTAVVIVMLSALLASCAAAGTFSASPDVNPRCDRNGDEVQRKAC
jgi:hypothetical protein